MMVETYYRKRFKRAHKAIDTTTDMNQCSPKVAGKSCNTSPKPTILDRHKEPSPLLSEQHSFIAQDEEEKSVSKMQNHIKVGNVYELDHSHLPRRSPAHLNSIRVVVVSEKTDITVIVKFPSVASLKAFFSNRTEDQTQPIMDENYEMGTWVAAKLLARLVPDEILNQQKSREAFWLMSSLANLKDNADVGAHNKGVCLSELLGCKRMVRWGIQRQAIYIIKEFQSEIDDDDHHHKSLASSFVKQEDDMKGSHNDEEQEDYKILEQDKIKKGKRAAVRNIDHLRKSKKEKLDQKNEPEPEPKKKKKKKNQGIRFKGSFVLRNPKDRWPAERYKLAEESLLEVMKQKGATSEKPILRPLLRKEARKRIGDTGLLDHLLKHTAGRVTPGGKERFRRWHNADGAMEYWLESADLANIRNNVGVNDPFWVPPPGWSPGASPTQDSVCARELKVLKEEISKVKRDVEEMTKKMHLEEEVEKLRRELEELTSTTNMETEITVATPCRTRDQLEQLKKAFEIVDVLEKRIDLLTSDVGGRTTSDAIAGEEEVRCKKEASANTQRLQSGFRICRPEGTFLWPDMAKNCTTNSINSDRISSPIASPIKPLGKRRAVTVTVGSAYPCPCP
ncbi:protein DYAD-like [Andrographis paniculata]|uniref:protein DYAD-like n=1 Tax=Andrographis paniculata TaxID=175694 RepID=UPI0021E84437|nr:protein DYAD-like [Andrographis paniculata]